MFSTIKSLISLDNDRASQYILARRIAIVAGTLAVVVAVLLLVDYRRRLEKDPLDSPTYKSLKAALAASPKDEALKLKIRHQDMELRNQYFRQRAFTAAGGWMLIVSTIVALLSARAAATLRRKLPTPELQAVTRDPEIAATQVARQSIGGAAAALTLAALVLILVVGTPLARTQPELVAMIGSAATQAEPAVRPAPHDAAPRAKHEEQDEHAAAAPGKSEKSPAAAHAEPEKQTMPAPTAVATAEKPAAATAAAAAPAAPAGPAAALDPHPPSDEEIAKNWPKFRGPGGRGIAAGDKYPTNWDAESGKSILWKSAIPMPGHNSPVLWGDKISYSGADEKTRKIFCVDAGNGKLLWEAAVPLGPESPKEVPKIEGDTGYAAPTMATDGRRAFAIFPNGDVAAVDYAGHVAWIRSLGMPQSQYGFASSLVTYKNLVLAQFDVAGPKDGRSKFYGLDMATGKTVWQTARPVPNGWSSPLVAHLAGRDQLITTGDPWVIAYDPADGKELWRSKSLRQDVGPSPTFAAELVFATNSAPALAAIRPDGQGDVTEKKVAWIGEDGLPDITSPLATDEYVFLLASEGTLTCYETKKGKKLWEKDIDAHFKASPSMAGKYVYLLSEEGKCWVLEPGPKEAKEIATGNIGEACTASPVFHQGRIYLRGAKHLFCIGTK